MHRSSRYPWPQFTQVVQRTQKRKRKGICEDQESASDPKPHHKPQFTQTAKSPEFASTARLFQSVGSPSTPLLRLNLPRAVPGTPQGETCRAVRCQLSSGVPPSPIQPASKPAAPRLHKTVASTRLCQGRSAGKGLARGGEGRLFSRPCNFPRSRLTGPAGVGRRPGPSQGRRAAGQDGVGEWESAEQPSGFCFPFFPFFF